MAGDDQAHATPGESSHQISKPVRTGTVLCSHTFPGGRSDKAVGNFQVFYMCMLEKFRHCAAVCWPSGILVAACNDERWQPITNRSTICGRDQTMEYSCPAKATSGCYKLKAHLTGW